MELSGELIVQLGLASDGTKLKVARRGKGVQPLLANVPEYPMNLAFAASTYLAIRDRIRAQDPLIDEQTLADTVEGLTDLHEILAAVVRAALADEALARGLKCRIRTSKGGSTVWKTVPLNAGQIAKDVMVELDLRKLAAPDFNVCIRPGLPCPGSAQRGCCP